VRAQRSMNGLNGGDSSPSASESEESGVTELDFVCFFGLALSFEISLTLLVLCTSIEHIGFSIFLLTPFCGIQLF